MTESDRRDVAARLRAVIAGQDDSLADTARRLRVDEVSLRMSIDEVSPYPTLDVIAAVVTHYGIDPVYLITGGYDLGTHRRVLAEPASAIEVVRELSLLRGNGVRISRPVPGPPHQHIA